MFSKLQTRPMTHNSSQDRYPRIQAQQSLGPLCDMAPIDTPQGAANLRRGSGMGDTKNMPLAVLVPRGEDLFECGYLGVDL